MKLDIDTARRIVADAAVKFVPTLRLRMAEEVLRRHWIKPLETADASDTGERIDRPVRGASAVAK